MLLNNDIIMQLYEHARVTPGCFNVTCFGVAVEPVYSGHGMR